MSDFVNVQRGQLDVIKLQLVRRVAKSRAAIIRNARLDVNVMEDWQIEQLLDDVVYSFDALVLGKRQRAQPEKVYFTTTVRVPASWWQAFKLSAIRDGNPFFDPEKVRFADAPVSGHVVINVERDVVWPDSDFTVDAMTQHYGTPVVFFEPPTNWVREVHADDGPAIPGVREEWK